MKIYLVTTNQHKLREIRQIFGSEILAAQIEVNENGKTFEANALKKSKAVKLEPDSIALADDSGLVVDALGGRPGVKSARFAGPNPTSEKLCKKLLRLMKGKGNRKAAFVCNVAIVWPNGKHKIAVGIVKGRIIGEMRGEHGFGYDPVFVPTGYKKTFAQMSPVMKNRLSHRGRAFRKVERLLSSL
ncbi:MAG: RdgB/HAM1 family non-canonical purine NTP pyrophosphatase [Candidatus Saganbacteria bacterium]|nr:RdgB/HAM1 family non-canonical purine NTP pyrophosphatase [Candidatus Saganbacteria bacterium]